MAEPQPPSPPAPAQPPQPDRAALRAKLRQKLAGSAAARKGKKAMRKPKLQVPKSQQKKLAKKVRTKGIDELLAQNGVTDPGAKTALIEAMRSGQVNNGAELQAFLANFKGAAQS